MFDQKVREAREDTIVRNLVKHGGTCVLVLGGAHDLTDMKRLSDCCGYIGATPKGCRSNSTEGYLEAAITNIRRWASPEPPTRLSFWPYRYSTPAKKLCSILSPVFLSVVQGSWWYITLHEM